MSTCEVKGEAKGFEAWAVPGTGEPSIPYGELFEVARVTLEAAGRGGPDS